jgi:hypothetical protein
MNKRTKMIVAVLVITILWSLVLSLIPSIPVGPTKCHEGVTYFSRVFGNPTPVYNLDGSLKACKN